jgi:hypothetical protein
MNIVGARAKLGVMTTLYDLTEEGEFFSVLMAYGRHELLVDGTCSADFVLLAFFYIMIVASVLSRSRRIH